jgi:hypothetical protein
MNKALCVAVLLLGTVVLTGRHSTATPSGPAYPQIVAKGRLLNQTGELAQTTIFTPSLSGLYRLSVYGMITTADTANNQNSYYNLFWTDASGPNSYYGAMLGYDGQLGGFNQSTCPLATFTFQAQAGAAVSHSVTKSGTDNAVYALYWTIERLE